MQLLQMLHKTYISLRDLTHMILGKMQAFKIYQDYQSKHLLVTLLKVKNTQSIQKSQGFFQTYKMLGNSINKLN